MDIQPKTLYIIVPCYNEEAVLPDTNNTLVQLLDRLLLSGKVSGSSRICYVDDGSKDGTWALIQSFCNNSNNVSGIKLSRNRGHQNAVLAGLMTVRGSCDMAVSIDADLQDNPDVIEQFVDHYYDGCEVVYGVRSDRDSDTSFKRSTAQSYYKLLELLGVEIVYNHADFRLLGKRALDALAEYGESNLFLRGIIPQLGFKTATVEYARTARLAGESKYTLSKMLSLAADGVTSFSVKPLRMVTAFSVLLFLICVIGWVFNLISGISFSESVILSIWSACSMILLAVSLIGEYIGRTYIEVKQRPRFFIDEYINK